jgi:polyisoprenoid-binding protein YceI
MVDVSPPNPTCATGRKRCLLQCTGLIVLLLASIRSSEAEESSNAFWAIRKEESALSFRVAFEESAVAGRFRSFIAFVRFDPHGPGSGSIDLRVDSESIITDDAGAAAIARQSNWLNVVRYPEILFHSRGIRSLGGNQYVADGVLSLKGISRPLSVPFTWTDAGSAARLHGKIKIRRSTYGIGGDSVGSTSPIAPAIGDEVAVSFTISLFRTSNMQSVHIQ